MAPGPFTLVELVQLYRGKCRHDSVHTASILTMMANCNRDPKKHRPYRLTDFLPAEFAKDYRTQSSGMTSAQLRRLKPYFEKKA